VSPKHRTRTGCTAQRTVLRIEFGDIRRVVYSVPAAGSPPGETRDDGTPSILGPGVAAGPWGR
jgi:hypothetical protein